MGKRGRIRGKRQGKKAIKIKEQGKTGTTRRKKRVKTVGRIEHTRTTRTNTVMKRRRMLTGKEVKKQDTRRKRRNMGTKTKGITTMIIKEGKRTPERKNQGNQERGRAGRKRNLGSSQVGKKTEVQGKVVGSQ